MTCPDYLIGSVPGATTSRSGDASVMRSATYVTLTSSRPTRKHDALTAKFVAQEAAASAWEAASAASSGKPGLERDADRRLGVRQPMFPVPARPEPRTVVIGWSGV